MSPSESPRDDFLAMATVLRSFEDCSELPSDYYSQPTSEANSNWAQTVHTLIPTTHKLVGRFDTGIIYGAMTDTMICAGLETQAAIQSGELELETIVFGAGMRALKGRHDKRGLEWLQSHNLHRLLVTEADAAEAVVSVLFGGKLIDEVREIETPVIEIPNELGPRQWAYRRYEGRDGEDLIVVNGKSVTRATPDRVVDPIDNRHTTRSVMQEIAHMFPDKVIDTELLVIAASLHALRMGAETAAVGKRSKENSKVTVYPLFLTPYDKYGVDAARIARKAYLEHVPSYADSVQMAPELDVNNGDLIRFAHNNAALVLLLLEQPAHASEFNPGNPISTYLDPIVGKSSEVRRMFDPSKLLAAPEALERAYSFLREMGFGSKELGMYKGEKPYVAAVEGGRALKYAKELELLSLQEKAPHSITLFGTPHRVVGHDMESVEKEFEEAPGGMSDVVRSRLNDCLVATGKVTEYDLAEAFALDRVVDADPRMVQILASNYALDGSVQLNSFNPNRHVRYWGKDADGTPVTTAMVDREYELGDTSKKYTTLGVAGTLELADAVQSLLIKNGLAPEDMSDNYVVAMVSSHLYAATRKLYIEGSNRVASSERFVGLFYGPGGELPDDPNNLSDLQLNQLGSELRTVIQSVEKVQSEIENSLKSSYAVNEVKSAVLA